MPVVELLVCELTRCDDGARQCVRQRTVELDLPGMAPGTYMLLAATFAAGQRGPFELKVLANAEGAAVEQVYPPVWRHRVAAPAPTAAEAPLVITDLTAD